MMDWVCAQQLPLLQKICSCLCAFTVDFRAEEHSEAECPFLWALIKRRGVESWLHCFHRLQRKIFHSRFVLDNSTLALQCKVYTLICHQTQWSAELPQWLSHYTLSSHWLQDQLSPVCATVRSSPAGCHGAFCSCILLKCVFSHVAKHSCVFCCFLSPAVWMLAGLFLEKVLIFIPRWQALALCQRQQLIIPSLS